jgi:hypothetical protein
MRLESEINRLEKLLGGPGDNDSCICQPPSTLMIWQYTDEVAEAFFSEAEVGNVPRVGDPLPEPGLCRKCGLKEHLVVGNVVFDDSPATDWRNGESNDASYNSF